MVIAVPEFLHHRHDYITLERSQHENTFSSIGLTMFPRRFPNPARHTSVVMLKTINLQPGLCDTSHHHIFGNHKENKMVGYYFLGD